MSKPFATQTLLSPRKVNAKARAELKSAIKSIEEAQRLRNTLPGTSMVSSARLSAAIDSCRFALEYLEV